MLRVIVHIRTVILIVDPTEKENSGSKETLREIIDDRLYDNAVRYGHYSAGMCGDDLVSAVSPVNVDDVCDTYFVYEWELGGERLKNSIDELIEEVESYPFVSSAKIIDDIIVITLC